MNNTNKQPPVAERERERGRERSTASYGPSSSLLSFKLYSCEQEKGGRKLLGRVLVQIGFSEILLMN
jgi:hypothetical protein